MEDWSARQYLKFEDERTAAAARSPGAGAAGEGRACVVDLGCGPGNSTELLVERYPQAAVIGPGLLARHAAHRRASGCRNAPSSKPISRPGRRRPRTGLLFANAAFQWVPIICRICGGCSERCRRAACCAVQMPDNTRRAGARASMREVASGGPWARASRIKRRRARRPAARRKPTTTCSSRSATQARHLAQRLQPRD